MNEYVAIFWAVMLLFCSIGSLVIAKIYENEKANKADAEAFWRSMQANLNQGNTNGHLYGEEDELHEPPLLPEDYRDWNSKK